MAGGYLTLPWKLLSMAVQWQRAAAAWRRTVARGVKRDATAVWAPVPGQGHVRGPDRGRSSILLPCAAWLVHPDPLPSWQAFSAPVSHLEGVCTVICKIVTMCAT